MSDGEAVLIELTSVRDWLRFAVSRFNSAQLFFGHGSQDAYDEAAYLVLHTLHLPLDRLEPFLDAHLLKAERRAVYEILRRRVEQRIPAAYLTKEAWLGDFRFFVDERVIIPRSYFAGLLEEGFAPWVADADAVTRGLDLCTGSGCLAVLMAHAFPSAAIDAVDISDDALEVAKRNIADYGLEHRIETLRSDLFSALSGRRYDLIVCNPPYVTGPAMRALPAEYRHEPKIALAAGEDGLDAVRRILAGAERHLTPTGLLAVEVGHNRALVEASFPGLPFTWLSPEGVDAVFLLQRSELPNAVQP